MNWNNEHGYAILNNRGAGYYSDRNSLLKAESYLEDIQIIKCASVNQAREIALSHLHHLQPNLKKQFNLLSNFFQYTIHFKPTDFEPLDPWNMGGYHHA